MWITPELLGVLHDGPNLLAELACAPGCPAGDLLSIHDMTGRRVLYQITGPAPSEQPLWEARWPD